MKVRDIKTSCNGILTAAMPACKVYGNDTLDGYTRPAWFTEIIPRTYRTISESAMQAGFTYKATLLETTHDEAFCLDAIDTVREAFKFSIKCGDMHLLVEDFDWDWIDQHNDVLQITIDFAEFVVITNLRTRPGSENYDLMETLDMDIYLRPSMHEFLKIINAIKRGEIRFSFTNDGRLIVHQVGEYEEYLRFDIADGILTASMIEALSQAVTFYIDGTGHLFASYKSPSGVEEKFNIYVTEGE